MNTCIIFLKRPLFYTQKKIVNLLCKHFSVKMNSISKDCVTLSNDELLISVRKRIIDFAVFSDNKTHKKYLFTQAKSLFRN